MAAGARLPWSERGQRPSGAWGCAEGCCGLLKQVILCHKSEAAQIGCLRIHPEVAPAIFVMEEALGWKDLEEVAIGQLAAGSQPIVVRIIEACCGHFCSVAQPAAKQK